MRILHGTGPYVRQGKFNESLTEPKASKRGASMKDGLLPDVQASEAASPNEFTFDAERRRMERQSRSNRNESRKKT
jgi:hypothetical protein